jgi:hypothetical protein
VSALLLAHENKTCIHFHAKYTLSVMVEGVPVPRFLIVSKFLLVAYYVRLMNSRVCEDDADIGLSIF